MDESHEIYHQMMPGKKPELGYCPKCGSSGFPSLDSGRSYKCRDCNFHFFVNNSAAVACLLFNADGELLLTKRAFEPNKGMLDLPGGFVEPLESAEEAVKREIHEELNIRLTKILYLGSFPNQYTYSDFTVPTLDMAFLGEAENLDDLVLGDDVASIKFIRPEVLNISDLCSISMQNILHFYLTNCSK